MNAANVLHVNTVEEQTAYRKAVAQILLDIQQDKKLTLLEIAEQIDVSLGTISNAANKKNDLSPTYLNRLAKRYGAHFLSPFAALSGGRVVPIECDEEADALPSTTAAIHKLALASSPNSPGGSRIVHTELCDMEAEIEAAIRALHAIKRRCEAAREGKAA